MKKDFKMFILSRVKFAKKRLNHDRRTHFGLANKKRSVAEDFCMTDLRHQNRGNAPESRMELDERREQIERAIRRFTSKPHWRELIHRRIFHRERIKDLAEEYGVPAQSARRKVSEARAFIRRKLD